MFIFSLLFREKLRIQEKLDRISREIDSLPEGSIQIYRNHIDSWRWCLRTQSSTPGKNVKRKDIPKSQRQIAEQLCHKRMLMETKSYLEHNKRVLETFLEDYTLSNSVTLPENPEFRNLLRSYYEKNDLAAHNLTSEAYIRIDDNWASEPYTRKTDHPENLTIPTKAGFPVRSKSEALICNELFDAGIPFRYEQALDLGGIILYPDFTIRHPSSGKIIIWEHFGLLEMEDYTQNVIRKLSNYLQSQFIPGDNLILTYESRSVPLDVHYIELLIYYHFGR